MKAIVGMTEAAPTHIPKAPPNAETTAARRTWREDSGSDVSGAACGRHHPIPIRTTPSTSVKTLAAIKP